MLCSFQTRPMNAVLQTMNGFVTIHRVSHLLNKSFEERASVADPLLPFQEKIIRYSKSYSMKINRKTSMGEPDTVCSPRLSTEVCISSSESYEFPVTKGPREAITLSGLPISSMLALGLLVKRISGEATT
ncbi:hypothetical protein CKAN_00310900 [Cinnamomum micranthum f. kanehirae]|uniref:Uncharacterized protein n=1 Tax=Cinnamomum micranthum f. kanehirae TaxID=337451 RepID=A0A443N8G0_9MAGN|nr:hypothetical protein CKAN_00310900 [Cinnamomum micranthum f. kanehirae]